MDIELGYRSSFGYNVENDDLFDVKYPSSDTLYVDYIDVVSFHMTYLVTQIEQVGVDIPGAKKPVSRQKYSRDWVIDHIQPLKNHQLFEKLRADLIIELKSYSRGAKPCYREDRRLTSNSHISLIISSAFHLAEDVQFGLYLRNQVKESLAYYDIHKSVDAFFGPGYDSNKFLMDEQEAFFRDQLPLRKALFYAGRKLFNLPLMPCGVEWRGHVAVMNEIFTRYISLPVMELRSLDFDEEAHYKTHMGIDNAVNQVLTMNTRLNSVKAVNNNRAIVELESNILRYLMVGYQGVFHNDLIKYLEGDSTIVIDKRHIDPAKLYGYIDVDTNVCKHGNITCVKCLKKMYRHYSMDKDSNDDDESNLGTVSIIGGKQNLTRLGAWEMDVVAFGSDNEQYSLVDDVDDPISANQKVAGGKRDFEEYSNTLASIRARYDDPHDKSRHDRIGKLQARVGNEPLCLNTNLDTILEKAWVRVGLKTNPLNRLGAAPTKLALHDISSGMSYRLNPAQQNEIGLLQHKAAKKVNIGRNKFGICADDGQTKALPIEYNKSQSARDSSNGSDVDDDIKQSMLKLLDESRVSQHDIYRADSHTGSSDMHGTGSYLGRRVEYYAEDDHPSLERRNAVYQPIHIRHGVVDEHERLNVANLDRNARRRLRYYQNKTGEAKAKKLRTAEGKKADIADSKVRSRVKMAAIRANALRAFEAGEITKEEYQNEIALRKTHKKGRKTQVDECVRAILNDNDAVCDEITPSNMEDIGGYGAGHLSLNDISVHEYDGSHEVSQSVIDMITDGDTGDIAVLPTDQIGLVGVEQINEDGVLDEIPRGGDGLRDGPGMLNDDGNML